MLTSGKSMNVVLCIQACEEEEGCVQFTLEGIEDLRFHLSAQQARDIAAHLIQHAHRSDVRTSLRQQSLLASTHTSVPLHLVPDLRSA